MSELRPEVPPLPIMVFTDASCVADAVNVKAQSLPKDHSLTLALAILREHVTNDNVTVVKIVAQENHADVLTKPRPVGNLDAFLIE